MGLLGLMLANRQAKLRHEPINFLTSDGRGYYAYLPAIFIDHTVDIENQVRRHWGEDYSEALLQQRTPRGYVIDKYPIGLAITLTPSFLLAHAFAASASHAPDGYEPIYQFFIYLQVLLLGLATMMLIDHVLIRHFGFDRAAALLGILAFWIGSHYAWYYYREPLMVHVASTFWVTLSLCLALELVRDANAGEFRAWKPLVLTMALSIAVVCRPTNVFIFPILAICADRLVRRRLLSRAICQTPWPLGLWPLALQSLTWHAATGHWLYYSYEGEGFSWAHPALLQTLFSTRHGLFVWSPMLVLAACGIGSRLARERVGYPMWSAMMASFLMLWYLNSAWHCWWFGWSFGGRAFLEMAPIFCVGLAAVFQSALTGSPLRRRLVFHSAAAATLYSYVLMSLYAARYLPPDQTWF